MEVLSSIRDFCVTEREGKVVSVDFPRYYEMAERVDAAIDAASQAVEKDALASEMQERK